MPKITNNLIPPSDEPELYSVAGLAELLGVDRRTIQVWISKGKVKAIRVGEIFAIPAKEVKRLRELEEAV